MSGLEMNLTHYSNITFKPYGVEVVELIGQKIGFEFYNPAGRNEVCSNFL